jgi:hypothetical protein
MERIPPHAENHPSTRGKEHSTPGKSPLHTRKRTLNAWKAPLLTRKETLAEGLVILNDETPVYADVKNALEKYEVRHLYWSDRSNWVKTSLDVA